MTKIKKASRYATNRRKTTRMKEYAAEDESILSRCAPQAPCSIRAVTKAVSCSKTHPKIPFNHIPFHSQLLPPHYHGAPRRGSQLPLQGCYCSSNKGHYPHWWCWPLCFGCPEHPDQAECRPVRCVHANWWYHRCFR